MSTFQVFIIIVTLVLIYYFYLAYKNKELNSSKVSEYLTIYGIICGVLVYFDLAPQAVKIDKNKSLSISSLKAFEKASRKGRSGSGLLNYPDFYFTTFITNTGDLPVLDPILKFKFEYEPKEFNYQNLKAYIYNDISTKV